MQILPSALKSGIVAFPARTSAAFPARTRAALVVAAVLLADAVLHVWWSIGGTWSADGPDSLSVAVLGLQLPVSTGVLLSLAALLSCAAAVVMLRARSRPGRFWRRLWGIGTAVVLAGLLLRASLGVVWLFGYSPPRFFWLNALLYTPVCVLLSGLCWRVLGSSRRRWVSARGCAAGVVTAVVAVLFVAAYGLAPTPQTGYSPQSQLGSIQSRYVTTAVARFHYIRAGAGSPVVLLSPGEAWLAAWLPEFRALSASHTVFAVDLPGQGFTQLRQKDFTFDLDGMTSAIGSFLDAVHLPVTALAGNSWSGGWALAYAQRYPGRVSRLVLLAPSGLAQPDPLSWELLKLPLIGQALTNLQLSSRSSTEAQFEALAVHQNRAPAGLADSMWAAATLPDNVRSMYELEARLDWSSTQQRLPQTRQPTLIIWGKQDNVLPVRQAAEFGALMPHADVHVLDGCGHALTVDCPDQVNALMGGFLHG
jgi:4,5:9,10-diseco-3-hydroxy-5,9,17-trioxoandrosta-1(10),2-diene-4-oate hydrolase